MLYNPWGMGGRSVVQPMEHGSDVPLYNPFHNETIVVLEEKIVEMESCLCHCADQGKGKGKEVV